MVGGVGRTAGGVGVRGLSGSSLRGLVRRLRRGRRLPSHGGLVAGGLLGQLAGPMRGLARGRGLDRGLLRIGAGPVSLLRQPGVLGG